jgi:hypothetical protein
MKILEILIAMIIIYAILGILVSLLIEWKNTRGKARGKMLKESIFQMLDDPLNLNYGYLLINHPLVSSMNNISEKRPFQYLDPGIFADALIDVIGKQAKSGIPIDSKGDSENHIIANAMDSFANGLMKMNGSSFRDLLMSMYSKSGGNYQELKKSFEDWFNSNMDRTTGRYKRKQQKSLIAFGMAVALVLNIDSIHMFKVLSMDDNLRGNLDKISELIIEKQSVDSSGKEYIVNQISNIQNALKKTEIKKNNDSIYNKQILAWQKNLNNYIIKINRSDSINKLELLQANEIIDITSQLGLPIGWSTDIAPASWDFRHFIWFGDKSGNGNIKKPTNKLGIYLYNRNYNPSLWTVVSWLLGIIITGFMLSFGAPFWFDLLVKFVNIRKAGIKPIVKQ